MNADHPVTAGIDEAGRGPLAGPVIAAAVIFYTQPPPSAVKDSKCLSDKARRHLAEIIINTADAWAIGSASVTEIDTLNIHYATLLAMKRAIEKLSLVPQLCLIDGKFIPNIKMIAQAIVDGDANVPIISAASILAKVHRDNVMIKLDNSYPDYCFAQHKGYATSLHLETLKKFGPCKHHRRSFQPVRDVLS